MNSYNFSTINDKEFESLSVDIISRIVGKHVERFKPGPDAGVDGRFFSDDGHEVIIQCKHWLKSGFPALLRELKRRELAKLEKLKPKRYMLTTTLPLSWADKNKICDLLSPWIRNSDDILGAEDITDHIAKNPDIEFRHFKLWLTSANALHAIFNAGILSRSSDRLQAISQDAHKFVYTAHYQAAFKKLNQLHTVIITGEPGAGKTSLAYHLCLDFSAHGFEVYFLEGSIAEAESIYRLEVNQLFVFDDFLGRNYIEALERHEDTHIVNFIKRINRDRTKRFILTSRTTIINQGKQLAEIFRIEKMERSEFLIEVRDLSKLDRAMILYNHIWHSGLSNEYIDELYKDKRYRNIIDHKNFNPRLISFITDSSRLTSISSKDYWGFIDRTFNDPSQVWSHVFDHQLNDAGRLLVALTTLNAGSISEPDLTLAFKEYSQQTNMIPAAQCNDVFNRVIPVVVGALLNRTVDARNSAVSYDLFSPSIGDFIIARHRNNRDFLARVYSALDTPESVVGLGNMHKAKIIDDATYKYVLRQMASFVFNRPYTGSNTKTALHLGRRLCAAEMLDSDDVTALSSLLSSLLTGAYDSSDSYRALLLITEIPSSFNVDKNAIHSLIKLELSHDPDHDSLIVCDRLLVNLPEHLSEAISIEIKKCALMYWSEFLTTNASDEDVGKDIYDLEDTGSLEDVVSDYLCERLGEYNVTFEDADIRSVMADFDAYDYINNNCEREASVYPDIDHEERVVQSVVTTLDPIDDLFERH